MKPMRRVDRQMTETEALELLRQGEYGILSTVDSEGRPYGIPLNYASAAGVVYVHCATTGAKLQNIAANAKVCFTVVGKTEVLPDKFATNYESVIVSGSAAIIGDSEKIAALEQFLYKYSPDFLESGREYIAKAQANTVVVKITIDQLSGKHRVG